MHTDMAAPRDEPVIAMMKPDAIERGLVDAILAQLRADGLREELRREVQLDPAQVQALFLHPTPEYVAHLTSRPVSMHLLRGPAGPQRLYDSKCAIRQRFGIDGKLRNLIHGTDEGTEYHLFLSHFFPDLAPARHCASADLDLRFPAGTELGAARAVLDRLDAESDLAWVAVTLQPGQQGLAALQGHAWRRLQVRFAALYPAAQLALPCDLLVHAGAQDDVAALLATVGATSAPAWRAQGRDVTAAGLPIGAAQLARYRDDLRAPGVDIDEVLPDYPLMGVLARLMAQGVNRLNVFTPRQRLLETELLADLARVCGLHPSGGSAGQCPPGHFSISQSCVGQLGDGACLTDARVMS